jgi:hypothetical protein
MALTTYQIEILRHLSDRRKRDGVSYVAGGAALNYILNTTRRSRDIDIFHDTTEALRETWISDKQSLSEAGYVIDIIREAPAFIEADVKNGENHVLMQWTRDSAFRFFPLIEDDVLGLTLHPFDLATNKVLAMAGRLEVRDWIDTIESHRVVQPLGYLIWAAAGKDPGINPDMLLSEAARLHYSQMEIDNLDFGSDHPSASLLSIEWKNAISEGKEIIDLLPENHLGECILTSDTKGLYRESPAKLNQDLLKSKITYFKGSIGGAWPILPDV